MLKLDPGIKSSDKSVEFYQARMKHLLGDDRQKLRITYPIQTSVEKFVNNFEVRCHLFAISMAALMMLQDLKEPHRPFSDPNDTPVVMMKLLIHGWVLNYRLGGTHSSEGLN